MIRTNKWTDFGRVSDLLQNRNGGIAYLLYLLVSSVNNLQTIYLLTYLLVYLLYYTSLFDDCLLGS